VYIRVHAMEASGRKRKLKDEQERKKEERVLRICRAYRERCCKKLSKKAWGCIMEEIDKEEEEEESQKTSLVEAQNIWGRYLSRERMGRSMGKGKEKKAKQKQAAESKMLRALKAMEKKEEERVEIEELKKRLAEVEAEAQNAVEELQSRSKELNNTKEDARSQMQELREQIELSGNRLFKMTLVSCTLILCESPEALARWMRVTSSKDFHEMRSWKKKLSESEEATHFGGSVYKDEESGLVRFVRNLAAHMSAHGFPHEGALYFWVDKRWPWFWAITTKYLVEDKESRIMQDACKSLREAKLEEYDNLEGWGKLLSPPPHASEGSTAAECKEKSLKLLPSLSGATASKKDQKRKKRKVEREIFCRSEEFGSLSKGVSILRKSIHIPKS
jgi:hypothetical protein